MVVAWAWFSVAYVGVVVLAVVTLVCGDWPIFEGTLVQRFNRWCAEESHLFIQNAAASVCGEPGLQALASFDYYCCQRPNPILQLLYLAILGGAYFAVVSTSFGYASMMQRYTGFFGVVVGLLLFLMTSFSDPGTVNSQNVSELLYVYPYDGVLYEEKTCSTCNILRPARSKHCSICDRCVARFDHHCGWMNNCIGENNLRYFLAFLLWHCCLCIYGLYFLTTILISEVEKHGVIPVLTVYYGIENSFKKLFPHILQWLLAFYSTQILIIVFLFVTSLLLAAFFGYHIHLVTTNVTTNETFKWENYARWQTAVTNEETNEIQSGEVEPKVQSEESNAEGKLNCRCCSLRLLSRSCPPSPQKRKNAYTKGALTNIVEVLLPYPRRKGFTNKHLKSM